MWQYENLNGELYHYGVQGMHWGVRRYQNSDGSLTRRGNRKVKRTIKKINRRQRLMDAGQNVDALGNAGWGTKSAKILRKHARNKSLLLSPVVGAAVSVSQYKNARSYIDKKINYLADRGITLKQFTDTNLLTKERFTTYF